MNHSSDRDFSWVMAAIVAIAAVLRLFWGDWLGGGIRLTFAVIFGVIGSGLPGRSLAGKWVALGLLAFALMLIGVQWFGRLSGG